MNNYSILSASDFANAPSDPEQKFAYLEDIARRNVFSIVDDSQSRTLDSLLRRTYMSTVAALAARLGITGITTSPKNPDEEAFYDFLMEANAATTAIRVSGLTEAGPFSVKLGMDTKGRIYDHIERLRVAIERSSLAPSRKKALFEKLEELRSEMSEKRLSFAKTLALLGAFAVGAASFLADSSDAKDTITSILADIGGDKLREDAEILRLDGPPLRIEDQRPQAAQKNAGFGFDSDLDDDVPF